MPNINVNGKDLLTDFGQVDFWIFDLDNTLYPQNLNLMPQMRNKTYEYICELLETDHAGAAKHYERYEAVYGTAFNGLIAEYGIDPHGFLTYVHNIDHGLVMPDLELANAIRSLPGKRVIYTNGTVGHAENVLNRLGIADLFENIFDIVWADLDPKPHRAPYERLLQQIGVDPRRAAMFEDAARNLEIPFMLGTKTILVIPENVDESFAGSLLTTYAELVYIDYVTNDLKSFLSRVRDACQEHTP